MHLTVERAFIGFNNEGVVALRSPHGGDFIGADCPASMLPRVGAGVTRAGMRAWAAALSGAETPIRGAQSTPPPASRVLSSGIHPEEVKHQSTKTRDFAGNNGSQASLAPIAMRSTYMGDLPTGVISG